MKAIRLCPLLISFLYCLTATAQQTIQLLNGKAIMVEEYRMEDDYIRYSKTKDHKPLRRAVDRYDVYAITDRNGKENVIYSPADSFDFSVEEARFYIEGEKAAFKYYNSTPISIESAILGAGAPLTLPIIGLGSFATTLAPGIPMLNSLFVSRFSTKKVHYSDGTDPIVAQSEAFMLGYQKASRNIKIQHSIKWGFIGLGVGFIGLILLENNN